MSIQVENHVIGPLRIFCTKKGQAHLFSSHSLLALIFDTLSINGLRYGKILMVAGMSDKEKDSRASKFKAYCFGIVGM